MKAKLRLTVRHKGAVSSNFVAYLAQELFFCVRKIAVPRVVGYGKVMTRRLVAGIIWRSLCIAVPSRMNMNAQLENVAQASCSA